MQGWGPPPQWARSPACVRATTLVTPLATPLVGPGTVTADSRSGACESADCLAGALSASCPADSPRCGMPIGHPGCPHWRAAHPWKPRRAHAMQHHGVVASLQVVFRQPPTVYRGTDPAGETGPLKIRRAEARGNGEHGGEQSTERARDERVAAVAAGQAGAGGGCEPDKRRWRVAANVDGVSPPRCLRVCSAWRGRR